MTPEHLIPSQLSFNLHFETYILQVAIHIKNNNSAFKAITIGNAMFRLLSSLPFFTKPRLQLSHRVVLITGAAQGLGWELAQQLHLKGARLVLVDEQENTVKQRAQSLGQKALAIAADVTDASAMEAAMQHTLAHFGRIDVVIANAGITPPTATLRTGHPEAFQRVMDVNVQGVFNTVHPAMEALIQQGGHILVVTSCAAFCPPVAGAAYMVSKAAVEQLARGLSLELAIHGVSVTTAYLGIVDTALAKDTLDKDPTGRMLQERLPKRLRQRLSTKEAATTLLKAIQQRAPTVVAPTAWLPYAWFRGVLNPLMDRVLTQDPKLKNLLKQLEETQAPSSQVPMFKHQGDDHA